MENKPVILNDSDFELLFLADDEPKQAVELKKTYKILVTDDDKEVHAATNLLLRNFLFEGHPLEILHAYSGKETKQILEANDDLALIFLDVVMEENDTGLKLVEYIREELCNQKIRIILRTGQPGEAPEEKIIEAYDINDYRLKTELTATRLFTSVYEALRSYRDLMVIEMHRKGLEEIIKLSSKLFTLNSVEAFYSCILNQILKFENEGTDAICFRECVETGGFVFLDKPTCCSIVAATGKFEKLIGKDAKTIEEIQAVMAQAEHLTDQSTNEIIKIDRGYLIYQPSQYGFKTFIYVEGNELKQSVNTLKEFLIHYDLALDQFLLNQRLSKINCEIINFLDDDKGMRYLDQREGKKIDLVMMNAFLKQFQELK